MRECANNAKVCTFAVRLEAVEGTLAQLVEHRTENPGVPGSIPGGTTRNFKSSAEAGLFLSLNLAFEPIVFSQFSITLIISRKFVYMSL